MKKNQAAVMKCNEGHYSLFCDNVILSGVNFIQFDTDLLIKCENCNKKNICLQCDYGRFGRYCSQKCMNEYTNSDNICYDC